MPARVAAIVGVVLGVLGLVGLTDAALARQDGGGGGGGTEVVTPGMPRAAEMNVTIARVGVGGRFRPGEWAAIQVVLTNQTDKIRNVLVRAVIPDPDGDRAAYDRTIVSNPGATQAVWLYVQFPFTYDSGTVLTVTAFEAEEGGSDATKFTAGRELGAASTRLNSSVPATVGMMCVVGDRPAALDQYTARLPNMDYAPTGHELTEVLSLQLADLPDRVMGLLTFDTIVWTANGQGRDPTDLSHDQAAALREWVRRGGHLIVVLPNAGQAWLGRPDNPLVDLMPAATPVLFEGVDLNPMRRLLTDQNSVELPKTFLVQALRVDPGAGPYDAMAILNVPPDHPATGLAGQPIVVRRIVGQGAVTLVGLDVSQKTLAVIRGVEADVFWNRVIGRRINLLRPDELQAKRDSREFNFGNRRDKMLDEGIGGQIAKTAEAAAGLLLAFVVFGLYWLLAGPVGHIVLRRRDLRRHSWVAFVGIAGVFTALAWGGANVIKANAVSGNHLTFIDHVYGQSSQRTRTWANIHVPHYGKVRVSAEDGASAGGAASDDWHASVSPWDDPVAGSAGWGGFPDSQQYEVESRAPDQLIVPFRSTAKQVRIDWAGPVRDKWGMPRPVAGDGVQLGKEIRIEKVKEGRGWKLVGQIVHDLPKELVNVRIVVIPHQYRLNSGPDGALIGDAIAVSLAQWKPGDVIDFERDTLLGKTANLSSGEISSLRAESWLQSLLPVPSEYQNQAAGMRTATRIAPDEMAAISFFSMLEPPKPGALDRAYVARRRATHTLDLGRWFTQPCVIVVGQMIDGPSPTPLRVDGREVALTGTTVVRWVYPLPPEPPEYGSRSETPAAEAAPAGPKAEENPLGQFPETPRGRRR